jgi:hypothetical protein
LLNNRNPPLFTKVALTLLHVFGAVARRCGSKPALLATSPVRRVHLARIVHVATRGQTSVPWDLRGIVSKRLTAPYRSGLLRDWLKVKNPAAWP